jgi:hypothetical protein
MSKKQKFLLIGFFLIILLLGILLGLKGNFPITLRTPYPTVGSYINLDGLKNITKSCRTGPSCGELIVVDCTYGGDISHGPYYYVKKVNKSTGIIVSDCKRFCITMKGNFPSFSCPNCPPREWVCNN